VLTDEVSKIGASAPPTGGARPAEQTIETGQVGSTDHRDELIELGARVAFELPAVVGTCHPSDVLAQASLRAGFDPDGGRHALSAYSGFLDEVPA
jgi:hypothetical protein